MATIHDLNKSITDMSPEECVSLIKGIRSSRRSPMKSSKSKTARSSKKKSIDISAVMKSMSIEDKKSILKSLEEYL